MGDATVRPSVSLTCRGTLRHRPIYSAGWMGGGVAGAVLAWIVVKAALAVWAEWAAPVTPVMTAPPVVSIGPAGTRYLTTFWEASKPGRCARFVAYQLLPVIQPPVPRYYLLPASFSAGYFRGAQLGQYETVLMLPADFPKGEYIFNAQWRHECAPFGIGHVQTTMEGARVLMP